MSRFVDTRGHSTLGVGICDRCKRAFPIDELWPDPNSPGLKVCIDDLDQYDPYRLPARQSENITLPFNRPDVDFPVNLTPSFTLDVGLRITEDFQLRVTTNGDYRIIEVA